MSLGQATPPIVDRTRTARASRLKLTFLWLLGWGWRVLVGAILCFNAPYLSYVTSILVVGWMNRWMRARVLDGWRRESPLLSKDEGGRAGLPMLLPRWFLPEFGQRTPALWLNFKEGLVTILCVSFVLGWGSLLMLFSWKMGGMVAATHSYEEAGIVLPLAVIGGMLFIAGLLYVPLARVHMAVTQEYRSFFEIRIIWQLIRARLYSFCILMAILLATACVLEWMKTAPAWLGNRLENAGRQTQQRVMREYLFSSALVLFLAMTLTYGWAARVYRRALSEALKKGLIVPDDLPPQLVELLDQLELLPPPAERKRGLYQVLRWTWSWYYRRFFFAALVLMGLLFVVKIYVGEALNHHPFVGFMNHPLLQFPCVDYVPRHLL